MLCSNCFQDLKPIVAVDVDGTLGDYHSHFLDFAFDWVGIDHVPAVEWRKHGGYDGSITFSEYCRNILAVDLATYRQIKLAYRQGGMKRTMPIFDGAQALCWAIKDAGAELWITTTRPYLSLDNIVPDTVEWLRRHEIVYDGMLFDEDKYVQLSQRVDSRRVCAVLDDLPEMCYAAANVLHFGSDVPILVLGTYNAANRYSMMCDLDSAYDIVLARIKHWISYWKEQFDGD